MPEKPYPTAFETVLRAKKTIGAHLQTRRALQGAGIFLAIQPDAFPGFGDGSSHIDLKKNGFSSKVISQGVGSDSVAGKV